MVIPPPQGRGLCRRGNTSRHDSPFLGILNTIRGGTIIPVGRNVSNGSLAYLPAAQPGNEMIVTQLGKGAERRDAQLMNNRTAR
ncbi:hypothetical protein K443DRAFT_244510 [Laccaria amethystina LaAM-08-1]|uniref:Uncharacterized protein n=1 Tax=Laccaria amethystina LaAM-08-1 TaxID=1095629 RepID=A0A0C9WLP8_9AGAR|nr:hypothetical protein K443DRAFT_244510 [Laccaria amethystina LaAM-08-1]